MKKIFVLSLGLMSLVGLVSCDKLTLTENSFIPYGWEADYAEGEANLDNFSDLEASRILIKGMRGIVFDEIEKTDWKIFLPSRYTQRGHQPLKLVGGITDDAMVIDAIENTLIEIPTNYESIPVNLGNLTVSYDYLEQTLSLPPLDDEGNPVVMKLTVRIEPQHTKNEGVFTEYGNIVFRLSADYVTVKIKKLQYIIVDDNISDADIDVDFDDDGDETEDETEDVE